MKKRTISFGEWVLFTVVNLRLSGLAVFTHKIILPTPRLAFFIYIFNLR